MSDDQFDKLAMLLNKRFGEQNARINEEFDKRFTELAAGFDEKLDRRFKEQDTNMAQRFNEQEEKFDDQFSKLYQHVEQRADDLNQRIDRVEGRLSSLEGGIDQVLKNQETDQQERLVANHQLDRHEAWIGRAADAIDVSYDPGRIVP